MVIKHKHGKGLSFDFKVGCTVPAYFLGVRKGKTQFTGGIKNGSGHEDSLAK